MMRGLHPFCARIVIRLAAALLCCGQGRLAHAADYPIWSIDKYLNITRTTAPDPDSQPPGRLDILMARNESRGVVFMIGPAERELRLDIQLMDQDTLPPGAIEIMETIYIRNRLGGETGDALRALREPW